MAVARKLKMQKNNAKAQNAKKQNISWYKIYKKKLIITVLTVCIVLICTYAYTLTSNNIFTAELKGEMIVLQNKVKIIEGQWGRLEVTPIIVQPTGKYLKKHFNPQHVINVIKAPIKWYFICSDSGQICNVLKQANIADTICKVLLQHTQALANGIGYVTTPPTYILNSLTIQNREKLYPYLENENNPIFLTPFYYNSGNVKEWFYKSKLNKQIKDKLLSLVYVRDEISYISDIHLVLPYLKTKTDWDNLLQTLYRTPSLDIKLIINEGENIDPIINYWGNVNRTDFVANKLNKLKNKKGGGKINIAELLPNIPKYRLNTFTFSEEIKHYTRDCLWTMFNFYNTQPDERFDNDANKPTLFNQIAKPLANNSELKFGDIIILENNNKIVYHGCVYIAENIVFTKNGETSFATNSPFVFQHYNKMLNLYHANNINNIQTFSRIRGETNKLLLN